MKKDDIKKRISRIAPKLPKSNHIVKIALFGSCLQGVQNDDSDIDLLIEFQGVVTLFDMGAMKIMLEESLGKSVDLVTPKALSRFFRDDVLKEAETLYEQA